MAVPNGACWLDPADVNKAVPLSDPPPMLPEAVRAFGYLPDLSLLRAGDAVLVSVLKRHLIARATTRVQRAAGFDDWHAQWHHVAVYVGNGLICEAQPGGVKAAPLYKYTTGQFRVRFRRDPGIDEVTGYRLALAAALKLNYRFGFWSILELFRQAASAGWHGNSGSPKVSRSRSTICSELYADAYGVATDQTLDVMANPSISPAHLSVNRVLRDVPVGWRSLPRDTGETEASDSRSRIGFVESEYPATAPMALDSQQKLPGEVR